MIEIADIVASAVRDWSVYRSAWRKLPSAARK